MKLSNINPAFEGIAHLRILVRPASGVRYRALQAHEVDLAGFNLTQAASAAVVERHLNSGMLAHEAELYWLRKGERAKPVFKAVLIAKAGFYS